MTEEELLDFSDVTSGTINIDVTFKNDELSSIEMEKALVPLMSGDEDVEAEAEVLETGSATANQLIASDAEIFFLPVGENGDLDLAFDNIQTNYEKLDFTCEVL